MVSFKCPHCGGTKCMEYYVLLHRIEIKEFKLSGHPTAYKEGEDLTETEIPRTYAPMYDGLTYECADCGKQWRDAAALMHDGAIKATRERKPKEKQD